MIHRARVCRTNSRRDHPCQVPGRLPSSARRHADGTPITDTEIVRPKSKPYECPAEIEVHRARIVQVWAHGGDFWPSM